MKTNNLPDISLMMPVYNEEDCLEKVAIELIKEFKKAKIKLELYLVNNGSWDKSQNIITKIKKRYPSVVKVVVYRKNKTLGGAVNRVMAKYLKGKIIGFTCADGEVTAKDTVKLARIILKDDEIALAKTIRKKRRDGYRQHISKIYNWLAKLLLGVKTKDVSGWPVLIRYDVYKKMDLMHYTWIFQLEFLHQVRKMNKKFVEINVTHQKRSGGVSKVDVGVVIQFTLQTFSYFFKSLFR